MLNGAPGKDLMIGMAFGTFITNSITLVGQSRGHNPADTIAPTFTIALLGIILSIYLELKGNSPGSQRVASVASGMAITAFVRIVSMSGQSGPPEIPPTPEL